MKVLYRVEAPHFVAGFEVDLHTSIIVSSAPIIKYMRGKSLATAQDYFVHKGWKVERGAAQ